MAITFEIQFIQYDVESTGGLEILGVMIHELLISIEYIDPCMGSTKLVYAWNMLVEIVKQERSYEFYKVIKRRWCRYNDLKKILPHHNNINPKFPSRFIISTTLTKLPSNNSDVGNTCVRTISESWVQCMLVS